MAVVVIDTIKPKNNGTFPVVEAADVKVTDSKRLDAALNDKANQSDVTALQSAVNGKASQADLNALSSAVAGKQNALTTEQLAAANSGITSELVTQIGTNTTAIAGKASQADLTALETEVDAKADASDLTTATANLQSQIDEIVTPVTQDAEVQNARVGADGTTYASLKARCDATDNKLSGTDLVAKTAFYNEKYESIVNGNLVDKSTLLTGSYLDENGDIQSASGYYVTDYIPIFGNSISAKTGGSNALVGAAVYNRNFEFIRAYKVQNLNYSYTSGDAFIRIMLREEDIANARAFYGTTLKNYVAFTSDPQQNTKNINTLDSSVSLIGAQTEINKEDIANIENKFVSYERVEFSAFDTPTTPTGSTNFKGFATPYEFHGKISSVEVNASYFMTGALEEADYTLEILNSDFITVVASTTKTVSKHNGIETFTFENKVLLNGIYYFRITTEAENAYFSVANASTTKSKRSAETPNYYLSGGSWAINTTSYDIDLKLCITDYKFPDPPHNENVLYVGSSEDCDFTDVQSAINSITDDAANNPYIIYVYPGTYQPFTMVYTDNSRITTVGRVRYISIIGIGCRNDVVFIDNRGNYKFSPCEIYTNGVIKNISFIDKTDSEHHTQETGKTFAYAVHSDFGTCKVRFENCYMYSNAGAAIGIGTWKDEIIEFQNCRFESDNDGTYGETGHGAFFCHTATDGNNKTNQVLRVHDCIAIATGQTYGARLAVIAGYDGGTYSYELQNFGCFGSEGASASLQAPDNDLLSPCCFNNTPAKLNK